MKPLTQITGDAEFNEVFFDNVRVHESQILGGVNNGWAVGLTTLMYERLALGFGLQVRLRIALDGLVDLARRMHEERPCLPRRTRCMRQKLAQLWIDTEVFKYTGAARHHQAPQGRDARARGLGRQDDVGATGTSALQELAMEIQGPYGSSARARRGRSTGGLWQLHVPPLAGQLDRGRHHRDPANIIGERVLGLPKG